MQILKHLDEYIGAIGGGSGGGGGGTVETEFITADNLKIITADGREFKQLSLTVAPTEDILAAIKELTLLVEEIKYNTENNRVADNLIMHHFGTE